MRDNDLYDETTRMHEALDEVYGLFDAMHDEDAPDIADSLTRASIVKRTLQGLKSVKAVQNDLMQLCTDTEDLLMRYGEAVADLEDLNETLDNSGPASIAADLLRELDGRLMDGTPDDALRWIRSALVMLSHRTEDDVEGGIATMMNYATRMVAV